MLIYTCFINLYFYFIISFGISIQHFISKKIEKMFLVSLFYTVNTFFFRIKNNPIKTTDL